MFPCRLVPDNGRMGLTGGCLRRPSVILGSIKINVRIIAAGCFPESWGRCPPKYGRMRLRKPAADNGGPQRRALQLGLDPAALCSAMKATVFLDSVDGNISAAEPKRQLLYNELCSKPSVRSSSCPMA